MQTKVGSIVVDNRAELRMSSPGLGINLSAARSTQGDVDLQMQSRAADTAAGWMLTGYYAENFPRAMNQSQEWTNTSGVLTLWAGPMLYAGEIVTNIQFAVGTTNSSGLTNSWTCIVDPTDRTVLGKSSDSAAAWTGPAAKVSNWGTPLTIPTSKVYYVGLVIAVSTTMPTIRGGQPYSVINNLLPRLACTSNTGLTNPASLGATANAFVDIGASGGPWFAIG